MSNEKIGRSAAEAFWREFELGIEPIVNIARLIEQKAGVGVAYVDTPTPGHVEAWGSSILQIAFPFMLLTRPTRIIALVGILSFHIAIGVFMGLPWFSLTMIAIDAIFISDRTWKRVSGSIRDKWRSTKLDPPADKDSADIDAADATTELVGEPIHTPAALLSLPD